MKFQELLEGEMYHSGEWDSKNQRVDFKKAISGSRLSMKEIVTAVNKKLGTDYDYKGKNGTKIAQDLALILATKSKTEKDFKDLVSVINTGEV